MSSDRGDAHGYALPGALTHMYGLYQRGSKEFSALQEGQSWKYSPLHGDFPLNGDHAIPVNEAKLSDVPKFLRPWADVLRKEKKDPTEWDRMTDEDKGRAILQRYAADDLLGRD